MNERIRAGGLVTTETEEFDLGEHHGRRLHGLVERRIVRIALGQRSALRLSLTRARPTAIRVTDAAGSVTHYLPPNPDPWIESAQRLLVLVLASILLPSLARRR